VQLELEMGENGIGLVYENFKLKQRWKNTKWRHSYEKYILLNVLAIT